MDVISWQPFWSMRDGLRGHYPTLPVGVSRCEVAVRGGGISVALVAHELTRRGRDVLLLERDDLAAGSTSGSTALLQYEIDVSLLKLTKLRGAEAAARAYLSSCASIDRLERLSRRLGTATEFHRARSVYLASRPSHVRQLRRESNARRDLGLNVADWHGTELRRKWGCHAPGAIVSPQAAQMDPYRFTHRLMEECVRRGARVFDRTKAGTFREHRGGVEMGGADEPF